MTITFNPNKIKDHLDTIVVGQEDAKKTLSIIGYNHLLRYLRDINHADIPTPPRLVSMVVGPTGTGKTLLCNSLAEVLSLPYISIDATQLVPSGASDDNGISLYQSLANYKHRIKGTDLYNKFNYTIVYIDEVDKLFRVCNDHNSSYYDSLRDGILKTLDGDINDKWGIDTRNMLFILSGAFSYVSKAKGQNSQTIGYTQTIKGRKELKYEDLTKDDLTRSTSMNEEILGRIHVITNTHKLGIEDIRHVLFDCRDALIPEFKSIFELSGRNLIICDNDITYLLDEIYSSNQGMRAIKSVVFEFLKDKIFDLSVTIQLPPKEPEPSKKELSIITSPITTPNKLDVILDKVQADLEKLKLQSDDIQIAKASRGQVSVDVELLEEYEAEMKSADLYIAELEAKINELLDTLFNTKGIEEEWKDKGKDDE